MGNVSLSLGVGLAATWGSYEVELGSGVGSSRCVSADRLGKGCWAVVPVKRLDLAKSRLASALRPTERRALVQGLLRRTLAILRCTDVLSGVIVVGKDMVVGEIARDHGAIFFRESGSPGLNGALAQVAAATLGQSISGLLVLPGDLPRLTSASIEALVNLGLCERGSCGGGCQPSPQLHASPAAKHPCGRAVVIASDKDGIGTNALLVSPPDLIPFCFGPRSFHRHLVAARAVGIEPLVYHSPALALDLDTPGDLDRLEKADLASLLS